MVKYIILYIDILKILINYFVCLALGVNCKLGIYYMYLRRHMHANIWINLRVLRNIYFINMNNIYMYVYI